MFPVALTVMLFLFITGRNKTVLFIAGYTAVIAVFIVIKGMSILGSGIKLTDMERYFLLATSFAFLMLNFIGFVKKNSIGKLLAFFGFLYVAVDIALVTGLKLSEGLLYQPFVALLIIAPLVGVMLKAEGERI